MTPTRDGRLRPCYQLRLQLLLVLARSCKLCLSFAQLSLVVIDLVSTLCRYESPRE